MLAWRKVTQEESSNRESWLGNIPRDLTNHLIVKYLRWQVGTVQINTVDWRKLLPQQSHLSWNSRLMQSVPFYGLIACLSNHFLYSPNGHTNWISSVLLAGAIGFDLFCWKGDSQTRKLYVGHRDQLVIGYPLNRILRDGEQLIFCRNEAEYSQQLMQLTGSTGSPYSCLDDQGCRYELKDRSLTKYDLNGKVLFHCKDRNLKKGLKILVNSLGQVVVVIANCLKVYSPDLIWQFDYRLTSNYHVDDIQLDAQDQVIVLNSHRRKSRLLFFDTTGQRQWILKYPGQIGSFALTSTGTIYVEAEGYILKVK